MRRNVIETVMGAVVLLVAIAFIVFAFRTSGLTADTGYELTAEFNNASGLAIGSDVRLAGVKVGSVVAQDLDPETFRATITMTISDGIELPSDSSVRIIPISLLGQNYIEIGVGGEEDSIAAGGHFQHTQGAINLVDLLEKLVLSAADNQGATP